MKQKSVLYLFLLLTLLASCKQANIKSQLEKFSRQEIVIPENLRATFNGKDTVINGFFNSPAKLIVFVDSIGCSSCKIGHMYEWSEVIAYSEGMGDKFNVIFILAPKHDSEEEVRISLMGNALDYLVFIDAGNDFSKQNPAIPADSRFHTFLLDKENKVLLMGNPVRNDKLWRLYKEQIREIAQ